MNKEEFLGENALCHNCRKFYIRETSAMEKLCAECARQLIKEIPMNEAIDSAVEDAFQEMFDNYNQE